MRLAEKLDWKGLSNSLRDTHFQSTEDIHMKTAEVRKDIYLPPLSLTLKNGGGGGVSRPVKLTWFSLV
jgi:hypothetical protein